MNQTYKSFCTKLLSVMEMPSSLLLKLAVKGNTKELMQGIHTSSNKNAVDTSDHKSRTLLQLAAKEGQRHVSKICWQLDVILTGNQYL